MSYFVQVIWILSWPLLIFIIYETTQWVLQNYEKKLEDESE